MSTLLNILWFIFGGFVSALAWVLAGVLISVTIIGLPWAPAVFRMAGFSAWPFGRVAVDRDVGPSSVILNLIWILVAGWWLALHHIVLMVALGVTIIGIPFAFQHAKLAMLAFAPVGKTVVPA